jgi:outer membrane protein TolC
MAEEKGLVELIDQLLQSNPSLLVASNKIQVATAVLEAVNKLSKSKAKVLFEPSGVVFIEGNETPSPLAKFFSRLVSKAYEELEKEKERVEDLQDEILSAQENLMVSQRRVSELEGLLKVVEDFKK